MENQRNLLERMARGTVIADGAMGTQVARLDLAPGVLAESLNLAQPADIEAIHRGYVAAGAEIVLANTFGANRVRLTDFGLADKVREINTAAVEIARQAAGEARFVLGDMGPTGHDYRLPPYGTDDPETVRQAFGEQARALAEAGVDGILVETMMSLREACLAVSAAREACDLPVLCSMTFKKPFDAESDDFRTFWGDNIATLVAQLTDAGADALKANCGELVEEMPRLAAGMKAATPMPLIFQVNAGRPCLDTNYSTVYQLEPSAFADIGKTLVEAGASIVGGCCGTTPEHIRALRDAAAA